MDALKRYLYWIVLAALVAITVLLYLFWAAPAKRTCRDRAAERDKLDKALEGRIKEDSRYLDRVKKSPGRLISAKEKPIANSRHEKAAKEYGAKLAEKTAAMVETLKNHRLEVKGDDPIFPSPAPLADLVWAWQQWVDRLYPPVSEATTATVALPIPPDQGYEKPEKRERLLLRLGGAYKSKSTGLWTKGGERTSGPVDQKDQEAILRRYLLWRAIHGVLRAAEVRVPELHPAYKKTVTRPGEEKLKQFEGTGWVVVDKAENAVVADEPERHQHPHRVIQIDRIEFGRLGGAADGGKRPYRVKPVGIEFLAHPAVVPEVLRRLQSQERFVLTVRSMRMQQAFLGRVPAVAAEDRDRIEPDRYFEPPVLVKLDCEVLAFDETLDPVPKPAPPKTSASSGRPRGRTRRQRTPSRRPR